MASFTPTCVAPCHIPSCPDTVPWNPICCCDGQKVPCSQGVRMPALLLGVRIAGLSNDCKWSTAVCNCDFVPGVNYAAPIENKTYVLGALLMEGSACEVGRVFRYGNLTQCDIATIHGLDCGDTCPDVQWGPLGQPDMSCPAVYSYVGDCTYSCPGEPPGSCGADYKITAYLGLNAGVGTTTCFGKCALTIRLGARWIYAMETWGTGGDPRCLGYSISFKFGYGLFLGSSSSYIGDIYASPCFAGCDPISYYPYGVCNPQFEGPCGGSLPLTFSILEALGPDFTCANSGLCSSTSISFTDGGSIIL